MSRTTPTLVQGILQGEWDGVTDLQPYIDTASMMVDQVVINDTVAPGGSAQDSCDAGTQMTATYLELVERWLSAHFYQMADPGYTSRTTAGASGGFNGQQTMNFLSTRFGQQACNLDLTGFLARRSKEVEEGSRKTVQFFVG